MNKRNTVNSTRTIREIDRFSIAVDIMHINISHYQDFHANRLLTEPPPRLWSEIHSPLLGFHHSPPPSPALIIIIIIVLVLLVATHVKITSRP